MRMIGLCVICGKEFEIGRYSGNRKTCGPECHAENRRRLQNEAYHRGAREQAARKARGETAAKTLAKVNAEARAAHVSYGQYVAIMKDAEARHLRPHEIEAKLRGSAQW